MAAAVSCTAVCAHSNPYHSAHHGHCSACCCSQCARIALTAAASSRQGLSVTCTWHSVAVAASCSLHWVGSIPPERSNSSGWWCELTALCFECSAMIASHVGMHRISGRHNAIVWQHPVLSLNICCCRPGSQHHALNRAQGRLLAQGLCIDRVDKRVAWK